MHLQIKNMACLSCQIVVRYELEKIGITHIVISSGHVEILEPISSQQIENFKIGLLKAELELVENPKSVLVDKIAHVITEMINSDSAFKVNFSYYLSKKLNLDYTYMANIFSESQGITIEQFIIQHKIDKVKQLICFHDLTLTQISLKLHYSSVAHLSTQFKKITGITPSEYKHVDCNHHSHVAMCEL
jgi:AraC-like DNA-binding protein